MRLPITCHTFILPVGAGCCTKRVACGMIRNDLPNLTTLREEFDR